MNDPHKTRNTSISQWQKGNIPSINPLPRICLRVKPEKSIYAVA